MRNKKNHVALRREDHKKNTKEILNVFEKHTHLTKIGRKSDLEG
jgi:hypothetical protein